VNLTGEAATITYSVPEPFEVALKGLRKVLAAGNFGVAGELDISRRIRKELKIGIAPCRIFLVVPSPESFVDFGDCPCAAAFTPLHIVVSAHGSRADIHLLRALPAQSNLLDRHTSGVVRDLLARITRAVEQIGMRCAAGG
jgi:uncharacterized protein (DUF302 family)